MRCAVLLLAVATASAVPLPMFQASLESSGANGTISKKVPVIGTLTIQKFKKAMFDSTGANTTMYTLEQAATSGDCGQVDIPSVDMKPAQVFDKNLKVGTCASVGYSVADGTISKKVPVLGTLTIKKFKKAALSAGAGPSGTYMGSMNVNNKSVNATVKIDDASTMDFLISGPFKVSCPGQSYTLSSSGAVSRIVLPRAKDSCIYHALSLYKITDLSAQFDASANTIMLTLFPFRGGQKISVLLKHR